MALEGNLQDMPLVDLIDICQAGAKSGTLLLKGHSESGIIYIIQGRVADAFVIRKSDHQLMLRSDEAIRLLITWNNAAFIFRHDASVLERPVTISYTTDQLIQLLVGEHHVERFIQQPQEPALVNRHRSVEANHMPSMPKFAVELDLEPVDVLEFGQAAAGAYPSLTPSFEKETTQQTQNSVAATPRTVPGRQLLQAVMRRVRGL